MVKTITFDRGKEFAGFEVIEEKLKCKTYFCDPYCAWQKGTNENTNGLLREYYPKSMDLSLVNPEDLKQNLRKLNNRPRKCLKYKKPIGLINRSYINCCTWFEKLPGEKVGIRKDREDMKELLTAKANIDRILELDEAREEPNGTKEKNAE